jgi:outer membrane protein insertion porin family
MPARRWCVLIVLSVAALLLAAGEAWAQENTPNIIADVRIHQVSGRRIPAETIRSRMFLKPGDVYDAAAMERDFHSLWNTGYFEDIRFEREESTKGWIIHVYVKEKPNVREITYIGLKTVTQSTVLDRFKERKVGLTKESPYDPTKVKKAEVTLKQLLAERGHQYATIRTEIKPVPPSSVEISFVVKEGPKVKVGRISFQGNRKLGTRYLRHAMKNLRPIGVPHSIFLENLFSKTYDASKLSEDQERVRMAYQQKGYFKAMVQEPQTKMRDTNTGFHLPLIQKPGKSIDLTIPVEEGEQYRLAGITFNGNTKITNNKALRSQFAMKDGDIFNTELVRKGLESLRKAYGELGYINFTPVPDTKIDDEKRTVTLNIDMDEGKQYYVRRIEFQGNTTTRDKVIRRELAVEEGGVYNSRAWEVSLMRLNQLSYFEPLKAQGPDAKESTDIQRDDANGLVDLTLKVKEKGKNSIGLTGGVSGLAGSFIGFNYETNNFLGLGMTFSVGANIGSLQRNISFGFTQPYAFDRPLQLGFTVFTSKYDYNQLRQSEILTQQQVQVSQEVQALLQNFSQSTTGFTVSASYPLRRSFKRLGLVYSFDNSSLKTFSTASQQYFEFLAFRNISGPNALQGIVTSKLIPSLTSNTIDYPMRPHYGQSFYAAAEIAGLGGNTKYVRPIVEYKRFIPMKILRPLSNNNQADGHQTLGIHFMGSFLSGYGGSVAPPFDRFYVGGENDLRGFDIRSVTPYTFITNKVNVPLLNPDGVPVPVDPSNPRRGSVSIPIPVQQLVFTGADTSLLSNVEYRIPIAGPVVLAIFNDFGFNGVARQSQLRLSGTQISDLQSTAFGCPVIVGIACSGGQSIAISPELKPIAGTNWTPRMSTGLELQVMMPIVNAPLRVYYAYNPLRMDTTTATPIPITRSMFPSGAAGDFTFQQAVAAYAPSYILKEPKKTFRFSVSTTF